MAEYIGREVAKKYLAEYGYSTACGLLDYVPAADVRPVVRGHWMPEPDRYNHWHCSECGYVIGLVRMDCNYCPNCGCSMEVDE